MTAALDPDDPEVAFWPTGVWAQMQDWKRGLLDDGGMVVRTGDPTALDAAFAQTLVQLDGDLVTKVRTTGSSGDAELFAAHVDAVRRLLAAYAGTIRRFLVWVVGAVWAVVAAAAAFLSAYWGNWVVLAGAVGALLGALASRLPRPAQTALGVAVTVVTAVVAALSGRWAPVVWVALVALVSAVVLLAGWVLVVVVRRRIGAQLVGRGT